jgi:hypothetical protein
VFCLLPLSSAHDNKAHWIADDEKRLVNVLFNNYSNVIRPVENKKRPVPVYLGIALTQLIDLVRFVLINRPYRLLLFYPTASFPC